MNEVVEPTIEPIQEVAVVRPFPAEKFSNRLLAGLPVSRRARESWSTSLCAADLACLLQVIEAELIPQLMSDYSPARYAPQGLSP